ncbi:hypothetical protein ACNCRD_002748 [Escherichia coli]|nr:hypothetical protein [Escherichia coli]MBU6009699.1 hypothetical protein [Escherichia coli O157:H7]MBY4700586.1 hypothetical protein [Escherichia coli O157:H7]MBY4928817.1 hypothetical protein [Escherichia coli O157:H7]MCB2162912.1 hypothetical protein [Escherichia coli O157:H7]MCL5330566.1 hypothetical protein [Escherichia coli]
MPIFRIHLDGNKKA